MFVLFYKLSWVIQSPLRIRRMLCHCWGCSGLAALNQAVHAQTKVQGFERHQLRKGASWLNVLKNDEVWCD